jgi:hypothetical protein
MITFLASPKPFKGIVKEHQYRAIRTWLESSENVEVILYGDSAGIDEAGRDLGVQVVKQIDCAPSGLPYFSAIVAHAADHGKFELQVYLNCDILLSGIMQVMSRIGFQQFLLIGQRIDLGKEHFIDFSEANWTCKLIKWESEGNAKLHSPSGIDYFGFRRGMWMNLPKIIIGRGGYDNALLAYCMRNRIPIVDGTFAVSALHQFHDYNHVPGGMSVVMRGSEAMQNLDKAGGVRSATLVSDAGYVFKDLKVVPWICRGDRLRKLELKLRYEIGIPKLWMVLRIIWRALKPFGITRVYQPSLEEVVSSYQYQREFSVKKAGD